MLFIPGGENKMINSTLKMVRYKITEHYQDQIQTIYKEGHEAIDKENISSIKSLLNNWLNPLNESFN